MTEGNLSGMTDTSAAALAARVEEQLPGFRLPEVPRRFVLCAYGPDDVPLVLYWGLAVTGTALGFRDASTHVSASAERMAATLSRAYDVELVWLDPRA